LSSTDKPDLRARRRVDGVSERSRRWSRREQRAVFRPPLALFVERLVLACEDDDAALPTTRILEVSYHHPAPLAGHAHDGGTELVGLVDAGGAARGADEFVALEQLLPCGRTEVVHLLVLLVLLLLGVVVVVARRVLHHLNITDTRMAGVVVRGGCFLLHRPGCVGCVEAFFYARAARFFSFLGRGTQGGTMHMEAA
jgi:hypothetical protein